MGGSLDHPGAQMSRCRETARAPDSARLFTSFPTLCNSHFFPKWVFGIKQSPLSDLPHILFKFSSPLSTTAALSLVPHPSLSTFLSERLIRKKKKLRRDLRNRVTARCFAITRPFNSSIRGFSPGTVIKFLTFLTEGPKGGLYGMHDRKLGIKRDKKIYTFF